MGAIQDLKGTIQDLSNAIVAICGAGASTVKPGSKASHCMSLSQADRLRTGFKLNQVFRTLARDFLVGDIPMRRSAKFWHRAFQPAFAVVLWVPLSTVHQRKHSRLRHVAPAQQ